MPATKHTYDTFVEILLVRGDSDEIEARITFTYTPGCAAWWDRYLGAWMPGDPPEVEVLGVELSRTDRNTKKREVLPSPDWLGEMILNRVSEDELIGSIEMEDA